MAYKWQEHVEALAESLAEALGDPDLHPVLRANMLSILKEIEALDSAYRIVRVQEIAGESAEMREADKARFKEGVVTVVEEEADASEEGEQPEDDQPEHPEA